ncbi:MAG TPA: NADH-quinone oxidoreductase subunit J [Levilinea sp.]|nr:NADH-quinone oxidoreductase subunit J [Levilinea sp.]
MLPGELFLALIALVVVGTAIAMITSRNAVYSALFLVLNFSAVGLLYLMLGAPFIALVQITVYAGSIMVLFIFVIMLLGVERLGASEPLHGQRWLAIVLGMALLVEISLFFLLRARLVGVIGPPPAEAGSPSAIGLVLFTDYTLPFQVTGFILVAATVGAILLTRGDEKRRARPFSMRPEQE